MLKERDELHNLIDNLPNNTDFQKLKMDLMEWLLISNIETEKCDKETQAKIDKAKNEIENGEFYTMEEVFGELLNEI